MKTFRIVVGILAIIPVAMIVDSLFLHPGNYGSDSLGELLFPVIGVPILIFNMWAWAHPEIIGLYFLGRELRIQVGEEGVAEDIPEIIPEKEKSI